MLVRASAERAAALPAEAGGRLEARPACHGAVLCATATQSERATAAAGVLALATVVLLLVALIAAAGFVVVAQRRLRQLGMLAAVGATSKHLRLVLLANGATVGAVAAVAGTAAGLVAWIAVAPAAGDARRPPDRPVRAAVVADRSGHGARRGHRDRGGLVAGPDRRPHPGHRRPVGPAAPAQAGAPLGRWRPASSLVIGVASLAAGIDPVHDRANPLLVIAGTMAIVLAILLGSPLAIRASPPPPGGRPSRSGWPCATWPATRPVPERPWPRSASAWPSRSPS